jgi:membrane-associated phospholipid phosphatase
MSIQPGVGQSGYFARLAMVASTSAAQLVRSPCEPKRNEAARRLARNTLITTALAALLVATLMIWVDAWEIALMPPRNTPSLWSFRILTDFGKDTYVVALTAVLLLAALLVTPALHGSARRCLLAITLRLQFIWLAVAVPLAFGEPVKWIAGRGRPFVGGQADAFNFIPFAGSDGAYTSFPSAHAITAFALAFAIAAIWPRMRGVMVAYALLIAFTRLVLLAHHPSDVVAGAAIGIVGAMYVRYWFAARGLGFAIGEAGIISPRAEGSLKRVAGAPSAS